MLFFVAVCTLVGVGCSSAQKECSQKRSLEHNLKSTDGTSLGIGDFIRENSEATIIITDSDCPGITNGVQYFRMRVERSGTTLLLGDPAGSSTSLDLAGNDITTTSRVVETSDCKQTLSSISGSLNYPDEKLNWQYFVKFEQKGNCSAFIRDTKLH